MTPSTPPRRPAVCSKQLIIWTPLHSILAIPPATPGRAPRMGKLWKATESSATFTCTPFRNEIWSFLNRSYINLRMILFRTFFFNLRSVLLLYHRMISYDKHGLWEVLSKVFAVTHMTWIQHNLIRNRVLALLVEWWIPMIYVYLFGYCVILLNSLFFTKVVRS